MQFVATVRIDKWLWAVRLYRTRTLAASACTAGKVRIAGQPLKAARSVRIGEVITAVTGEITRTIKVTGLIERRVSAPLVAQCYEDLTPASEYQKPREPNFRPVLLRPRGSGRPTKKDRRKMEGLWSES
jgi:ribosome-associated heat shock protein Hsp15